MRQAALVPRRHSRGKTVLWAAFLLVLAGMVVAVARQVGGSKSAALAQYDAKWLKAQPVSSLGRIEPGNGVVALGARSLMGQPCLISELRVKEGDYVQAGQVLAILNSKDQLEAAWHGAVARAVLAGKRLEQIQAGAKAGDLAAQEAEVTRLRAELANAEVEHRRNQALFDGKVLSASAYDTSRLRVDNDRELLRQATERLRALAEVRETDLNVARADLKAAEAGAAEAKAQYEQSLIRSPIPGRVIKIHSWPGAEVGPKGVMELGQTDQMFVAAEVLEGDLPRIFLGQKTTANGDALPQPLEGVVDQIGMKVARSEIINTDPAAFADTRVIEVKVRLLNPKLAENFINAEVRVVFDPKSSP
jgi:HlyD family secretion protein